MIFQQHNASHHLAIRSTNVTCHFVKHYVLLWLAGFQQLWLAHFYFRCFDGLFPQGSVAVWLLLSDCGHLFFWSVYSTIPVDVVGAYMNCLFDPACVPVRVMFIDQLITNLPHCLRRLTVCSWNVAIDIKWRDHEMNNNT